MQLKKQNYQAKGTMLTSKEAMAASNLATADEVECSGRPKAAPKMRATAVDRRGVFASVCALTHPFLH